MNRESESYFRELPEVHIPRSKIEKPSGLKTTWSVGDIVPIYVDDILPGTTVTMNMAAVMRMQTPLYPTLDNLFTDVLFFFVPYRLVWGHFKEFWGENPNAWYPTVTYQVPQITASSGFGAKTVADYMGIPTGRNVTVNALPFRCYSKIFNDWFRSTPLQQEAPNTDTDSNATYNASYAYLGGALLKANKLHDMFTSCLPTPERGPEVTIPIAGLTPVVTGTNDIVQGITEGLHWRNMGSTPLNENYLHNIAVYQSGDTTKPLKTYADPAQATGNGYQEIVPVNLYANLNNAAAASISALRSALAVQHFYEASARYGSRYIEFLRGVFGVISPDARLQRSEYLGGKRIPHNIQTVLQTSSTDAVSPQGNTGAFSHTADAGEYFTKSFTEHGCLIGVMVTRYKHTYSQGVPKMFLKKDWDQWYLPQMNGISEVPVYKGEIFAGQGQADWGVFGYQEYGYEYRYKPDMVTAEMRPDYAQSLDAWHYGDDYANAPTLGATWIQEDRSNVDRTLVVSSGLADQLFGDFYFKPTYVLPMPIYSLPGIDKI